MDGTAEKSQGERQGARVDLKAVIEAAYAALVVSAAKINQLNVYPVPDGDTGTNMLLTLRSVLESVSKSPNLSGEAAARAVSRAALMGARGNSGVILSQILRGACDVLGKANSCDAKTISAALSGAKERAYEAVGAPVEGTMLSVIKDASKAARLTVERGENDPVEVLRAAAREAHVSVKRTPELLQVLREAGVVDAGGMGVAVVLDGLLAALSGEELTPVVSGEEPADGGERLRETVAHSAEEAWGYCTEFIVEGFSGDEGKFGKQINDLGKSVLVIPDRDIVKVHLHTQDPGGALTYAGRFGRLSGVKVDDMEAQTRARAEDPVASLRPVVRLGVVAASRGAGARELFESTGAKVIEGGQGANPSTEDFVRAVEELGARAVVLLPNNKNVVPTARSVGELVEAEVYVVPAKSIAGGLAALVGYDAEGEPEEVVEEMREIEEALRYAEVTMAVRDTRVDGREVREGEYIGLLDGEIRFVGESVREVAYSLAEDIVEGGADFVTLLRGEDLGEAEVEVISGYMQGLDNDLVVEVREGGQPLYPLQMVVE
ncbi:MAG TPA: DAK2 domain-containing protein [Rubrobacteraceae bacterium]|nr:DAK2 domain-containing protein [Rubrobacteraceae bacterium]